MYRTSINGLSYYQFERLRELSGLRHGMFTRLGGVSPQPYDSLNVGSTVGDNLANVRRNREQMRAALSLNGTEPFTSWQVHGADVLIVDEAHEHVWPPPKADIVLTNLPGAPLEMRFADCVPILLYDPVVNAAGIAHAGWRGTAAGAAAAAVRAMQDVYGSQPGDIIAGIGPSIGVCCYEVGDDVVTAFGDAFDDVGGLFQPADGDGNPHLDLIEANRRILRDAGVEEIELSGLCTACNTNEFFSHRAEKGQTGRFGVLVMIG